MRSLVLRALLCVTAFAQGAGAQEPPTPPPTETRATEPEQTEVARRFRDAGTQAFDHGDYATALRAFEAAWETLPDPDLQLRIARCQEELGHIADAQLAYQQYLHERPDAPDGDEVRRRVTQLRAREAELTHPPAPPPPPPPRRSLRVPALALLGVTVALGAAGTGAYLSEWSDYQSQRDACQGRCSPQMLDGLKTRVEIAEAAGGAVWGLAGAALLADVILWIADARAHREQRTAMSRGWRF